MELLINIDRGQKRSLQVQIYEAIRALILSGYLKSGQRLPSTRFISEQLKVSRNTVILAYDRLAAEDYVESNAKSGVFVNKNLPEKTVFIQKILPKQISQGKRLRLGKDPSFSGPSFDLWRERSEPIKFDFFVGRPAPDSFPTGFWQRAAGRQIAYARGIQTQYGDPRGLLSLREAIACHLKETRGINASPDQILVTSGIQGALNLLARLFQNSPTQQSSVAIENPCYRGAAFIFKSYGARLRPIQVDEQGLIVEQLEGFLGSLVYVTPSHQFPTGGSLSLDRRLNLLNWANSTGGYIVEDDYDSDFRYDGPPLMAVAGLDHNNRVIYMGTFSKSIGPGIRLGYVVMPRHLLEQARAVKTLLDLGAPWLEQAIIADFLKEGAFIRHLKRIRKIYMSKRDNLINALEKYFPGGSLHGQDCGMHMMWRLPPDLPTPENLSKIASSCNVGLYSLAAAGAYEYGTKKYSDCSIILGYTALAAENMDEAMRRVALAIFTKPFD